MDINYYAMMETANHKHEILVDMICQLRNGANASYDHLLRLIHSIHHDEIGLIIRASEIEKELKKQNHENIQIMNFMNM